MNDFRTAYIEYETRDSKAESKELNNTVYKSKMLKVKDKTESIPSHFGRRGRVFF